MYEVLTLKAGCELYRGQPTPEIDCKANFHNSDVKNQNWNDSLYLFFKKEPAKVGYAGGGYLIKCVLNHSIEYVKCTEEYFATGDLPDIAIIVEETEKAIRKEYPLREDLWKSKLNYRNQKEHYSFMLELGNRGFAFSCYENEEDMELIIPKPLLENGELFTQSSTRIVGRP